MLSLRAYSVIKRQTSCGAYVIEMLIGIDKIAVTRSNWKAAQSGGAVNTRVDCGASSRYKSVAGIARVECVQWRDCCAARAALITPMWCASVSRCNKFHLE